MTRFKVTLLFILFIVSIGFLLDKGISEEEKKPSELASLINTDDQSFTIVNYTGDVYFGDGVKFTNITEPETVFPNKTYIKTDNGTAQILLSDNSIINLDKFTNIQMDFEKEKLTIKQLYGRTWHRIKDIVSYGEYRVETDNTITSVRGTIFSVAIDYNGNTDIHVIESEVEVTKGEKRSDGSWEVLDKGIFKAGERARIWKKRDILIERSRNEREFLNSQWYRDNTNSERLLNKLTPESRDTESSENGNENNSETSNNSENENSNNTINDAITNPDPKDVLGDSDPAEKVEDAINGVNEGVNEVVDDVVVGPVDGVTDIVEGVVPPVLNKIKIPLKLPL